jgi:hypothetical protein
MPLSLSRITLMLEDPILTPRLFIKIPQKVLALSK